MKKENPTIRKAITVFGNQTRLAQLVGVTQKPLAIGCMALRFERTISLKSFWPRMALSLLPISWRRAVFIPMKCE